MKGNISQARINQEIRNMLKQNLPYLKAQPLENDIYTWHFTIQGPENSDFHEGLYHGQILLPFEYPFKPPDMIFMNKNGRFQVNTKICLTITQYHPQEWNSAWTIRTMLEAVISLFNQNVQGIGYQQGSSEMRRNLAKKSHNFKCDKCGVLGDILKPRQPIKQQQKKQEEKPKVSESLPIQKLQYAPESSFKKMKNQDSQRTTQNKQKIQEKQSLFKEELESKKNSKKSQIINKNKQQKNLYDKLKKIDNKEKQFQKTPKYQILYPQNDVISLSQRTSKNYITMARALRSVKISPIE